MSLQIWRKLALESGVKSDGTKRPQLKIYGRESDLCH
jgi:hypothetical protein